MKWLFSEWKKSIVIVKILLFPLWLLAVIILGQTLPYTIWKGNGTHVKWYQVWKPVQFSFWFIVASFMMVKWLVTKSKANMLKAVWYDCKANVVIGGTIEATVSGSFGDKIAGGYATWNEKLFDRLFSEYDGGTWNHGVDSRAKGVMKPKPYVKKPVDYEAVRVFIMIVFLFAIIGIDMYVRGM